MNIFFMNKFKFNGKVLDRYQSKAVMCKAKNTLVVAAAGSGKTFTMAAKVSYLVNELNVNQNKILCISFTNESVNDMNRVFNNNNLNIKTMTFHKFAMSLIDMNKYRIVFDSLLEYITDEYFLSFIYIDNLDKLFNKYVKEEGVN